MRQDGWHFNARRAAWCTKLSGRGRFARQRRSQTATLPDAASGTSTQFGHARPIWRIWLVCIVLIAVVASQDGYTVWSERRQTIRDTERDVTNLSLVLAEYTSRYLAVADLVLQGEQTELQHIGIDTAVSFQDRLATPAVHNELARKVQIIPGNGALLLFGVDGQLVNNSRSLSSSKLNAGDRDFFKYFLNHDEQSIFISAPTRSRATDKWTLFLARRIAAPDGQFLGVVAAAIDIDYLQKFYRASRADSSQAVTLLRRDGVVVARYPDTKAAIGTSMPPQSPWYRTVANDGGTYRSPGFFGASASIVAARPLHDYPLVIDVVTSESEALAVWRNSAIWQGVGTLISVTSFIALFWLIGKLFRRQQLQSDLLNQMARHDGLTGLANRRVIVESLDRALARAHRGANSFALLYIDLDHFKDVNDTLGHPVGDLLLQMVAERLRASVREGDTVARFGGDEFAIILTDIREPADVALVSKRILGSINQPTCFQQVVADVAGDIADKVVRAIAEPMTVEGRQIRSGATVGITIFGPDVLDAETMLSRADLALYRAKSEGRGTYRFFTEAMDTEVRARVHLDRELREAITPGQLFLMYQPQVDIDTNRIVGLEALVRWHHPTRGVVGPGRFIPDAEKSGLIVPLGHWVMHEACRQSRQWLDAGIAPPLIAVNLSGVQFKSPQVLEGDIAAITAEFELPTSMLELELTESVLLETSRDSNGMLLRLRKAGHRIAIDDFGSGYSSLDYLRRYPVERIKIAQSFVSEIGTNSGSNAIVRAALGLARELDIEVVVEGVETVEQLELLRGWGCRIVQGHYFARPLRAADVTDLLRIGKINPVFADLVEIAASVRP
jgi:diguanylate cyclase (GGDEF)-like protein